MISEYQSTANHCGLDLIKFTDFKETQVRAEELCAPFNQKLSEELLLKGEHGSWCGDSDKNYSQIYLDTSLFSVWI